jgi:hypothetical protein
VKTSQAAKELIALLEEAQRRGATAPSDELRLFLNELAESGGLKKPRKKKVTSKAGVSTVATPRVGARPKRPTGAAMAKTIEDLAKRLRDSFENASSFETVLTAPETQSLSKANVVTLYSRVFNQAPAKSMSKPEIFSAMRRERINWVRGQR